ncbi:MAG: Ig domain-containing protein [Ruminiclostridium sp.]|nr:Ig domain-containing protein [Ruminiclostridium sp.]
MKKIISIILAFSLLISMGVFFGVDAEAVSLSEKSVKLIVGETQLVLLDGADSKKVEWTSENEKIAVVENGVIKGIKKGKTTVAAKYKGKNYKCNVTVSEFRIARESSSVMVGNRLQLDLVGFSGTRTWISSDESVATVSKDGILRGVSKGTAKISVKFQKGITVKTLSFTVTVKEYNFPVKASKTAYIKLTHKNSHKGEYITDKNKIKEIIKYADSLDYSFIEPAEAEEIAVMGYDRENKSLFPETLTFYDANGKEIGRFETALIDSIENNPENILGYFRYNQKYYRINGTSGFISKIYGWKTDAELVEIAEEYLYKNYNRSSYERINYSYSYVEDHPDYKTKGGLSFLAGCSCMRDYGADYVTIYIDPETGEVVGSDVLSEFWDEAEDIGDETDKEDDNAVGTVFVANANTGMTYISYDNGKSWLNNKVPDVYAYAEKTSVKLKSNKAKFTIVNNSSKEIEHAVTGDLYKDEKVLIHAIDDVLYLLPSGETYTDTQFFADYNYDYDGKIAEIITKGKYEYSIKMGDYKIICFIEIV